MGVCVGMPVGDGFCVFVAFTTVVGVGASGCIEVAVGDKVEIFIGVFVVLTVAVSISKSTIDAT